MAFPLSFGLPALPLPQRPDSAYMCSAIGVAVALVGAIIGGSGIASSNSPTSAISMLSPPPQPPPFILRNVSRLDAIAINARIPFSIEANVPAKPFRFRGDAEDRARALECLSLAVYYEAGNQDDDAEKAVAQVVLNRVRHPAFPASICGVVFQGSERKTGCQFTFTCDGALLREPDPQPWARAEQVAEAALDGAVFKPVGLATHYHANYVVPYWATSLEKNAQIGVHIFYRWPDAWGMPAAFARRYMGKESDPTELRADAIMAGGVWDAGLISPDQGISFTIDPRIELLSVVQQLADGSPGSDSSERPYRHDIESYFAPNKDDRAVQLFAKLSQADPQFATRVAQLLLGYSPPPELAPKNASPTDTSGPAADKDLAGFMDALRDFARASEFDRFFNGHKHFYSGAMRLAQQKAGMARAYWAAYTRIALPPRTLVLSTLSAPKADTCESGTANSLPAIVSLGALAAADDADVLLTLEGAATPLAVNGGKPFMDAVLDEQLIRAVFARVAALTNSDKASRGHVQGEVRHGFTIVPLLDRQLRDYEAHREQFSTWSDFMARVSRADMKLERAAPAHPCGSVTTALAEAAPVVGSSLTKGP